MSIKVMDRVADRKFKNATDKNIMMAMANHASDCGNGVWASDQTLGDRAGVARETANKCIARLEAQGLVEKTGRRKIGDKSWTNIYRIALEVLIALPLTDSARSYRERHKTEDVTERHTVKSNDVTLSSPRCDAEPPNEVTERHTNRPRTILEPSSCASDANQPPHTQPAKPNPEPPEGDKRKPKGFSWWVPYAEAIARATGTHSVLSGIQGDATHIAGRAARDDVAVELIAGALLAYYRDPVVKGYSAPKSVSNAVRERKYEPFLAKPAQIDPKDDAAGNEWERRHLAENERMEAEMAAWRQAQGEAA